MIVDDVRLITYAATKGFSTLVTSPCTLELNVRRAIDVNPNQWLPDCMTLVQNDLRELDRFEIDIARLMVSRAATGHAGFVTNATEAMIAPDLENLGGNVMQARLEELVASTSSATITGDAGQKDVFNVDLGFAPDMLSGLDDDDVLTGNTGNNVLLVATAMIASRAATTPSAMKPDPWSEHLAWCDRSARYQ